MMNRTRILINRMPWQRLLALGIVLILVSAISSCRSKNPVEPHDHNPTGAWAIYLSHDGVHLQSTNDTITVRVYNPEGHLADTILVHSLNGVSDLLHVSNSVLTTTDTASFPWGTTTPMVYWGVDTTIEVDTITSKALVNGIEVADTFTIITLINDF
jgi:hypothetical protein